MNIVLNNSVALDVQPLLTGLIFADLACTRTQRSSIEDRVKLWKLVLDHVAYPTMTIWYDDDESSAATDAYVEMIAAWVRHNTMNACVKAHRMFSRHYLEMEVGGDGINNFTISVDRRIALLLVRDQREDVRGDIHAIIQPHDTVTDLRSFLTYCTTLNQGDEPLTRLARILCELEHSLECEQLETMEYRFVPSAARRDNRDFVNLEAKRNEKLTWAETIPNYIRGIYIPGGVSTTFIRSMSKTIRLRGKSERLISLVGALATAAFGAWKMLDNWQKSRDVCHPADGFCSTSDKDGEEDFSSPSSQMNNANQTNEGDDEDGESNA